MNNNRELLSVWFYNNNGGMASPAEHRIPEGCVLVDDGQRISLYREKREEWKGAGLPPVGTTCEYQVGSGPWYECTVLYVLKSPRHEIVIFCPHLGFEQTVSMEDKPVVTFRPLRTPEQIAADERSKYCDRIYGVITKAERPENRSDMAEALYDAGLRFKDDDK